MAESNETEIEIERYILESMSEEERLAFEERMTSDPALKKAYETTLVARQLIKEAGRLELRTTLETFENEVSDKVVTSRIMPLWVKRILPIAALIVVFIGVYLFGNFNKTYSGDEVFSTYYEVYNPPSTVRNDDGSKLLNWETAVDAYKNGDYKKAFTFFGTSEDVIPDYIKDFYLGVSALSAESPNYEWAILSFDEVIATDNDYKQQALWYKALALLGKGESDTAMILFETIAEHGWYNHEKAAEIRKVKIEN